MDVGEGAMLLSLLVAVAVGAAPMETEVLDELDDGAG